MTSSAHGSTRSTGDPEPLSTTAVVNRSAGRRVIGRLDPGEQTIDVFEFSETEVHAIEGWLRSFRSDATRDGYRGELRRFVEFLQAAPTVDGERLDLASATVHVVKDFQAWRAAQGAATATVARSIAAVSSFYRYSAEPGGWLQDKPNPAGFKRAKRSSVNTEPIQLWQVDYLQRAATAGQWAARDGALIDLLFITGIRVAELCELNVGHVAKNRDGGLLTVTGKGRQVRKVNIDRQLVDRLNLARARSAPLLLNNNGQRFDRFQVYRITKRLQAAANKLGAEISNLSPHVARATVATAIAVEHGGPAAKEQLGHDSLATTQRYIDRAAAAGERSKMAATMRQGIQPPDGIEGQQTIDDQRPLRVVR